MYWILPLVLGLQGCSLLFNPASEDLMAMDSDARSETNCDGVLASFEDVSGARVPLDEYSGIDFGGLWNRHEAFALGGYYDNPSAVASFHTVRAQGAFQFVAGPRRLISASFRWAHEPVNLTITNGQDQVGASLGPDNKELRVDFEWSATTMVEVSSDNTWNFFIDEICHEAP